MMIQNTSKLKFNILSRTRGAFKYCFNISDKNNGFLRLRITGIYSLNVFLPVCDDKYHFFGMSTILRRKSSKVQALHTCTYTVNCLLLNV